MAGTGDHVPAALRAELVAAAAATVDRTEPTRLPVALRRVAAFAPAKRASAGAAPLWVALADDAFRGRVARTWAADHPGPAAQLDEGSAEPAWVTAAGAWLLGLDWTALLPVATRPSGASEPTEPISPSSPSSPTRTSGGTGTEARSGTHDTRLRAELDRARDALERANEREQRSADELTSARKELRRLRADADRARAQARDQARASEAALAQARQESEAAAAVRAAAAEDRRAAEVERTAARAELRVARRLADARVRLLLDTIVDAASGLRSELALPPLTDLPADLVAPATDVVAARIGSRGRLGDDPALLDELLRQPRAHLVVDGYNVSKSAYGSLPLEDQRRLLVDGLGALAVRTGAEVTCCFDGQEHVLATTALARGVRVRFSVGEIADDLIRRLVAAEPRGRVVVVVTSDREVARDVEADGAYVVASATLVARMQRG